MRMPQQKTCLTPLRQETLLQSTGSCDRGANVNARDSYQETPLHHAAYRGKTEVAALLIRKGANVNARNENKVTPLHLAASQGNTEVAALLIRKGANVNARDVYDETPLHHAAYWGKIEVAALLIRKGARVNARDENLETPLHCAAEDQPDVASLLIRERRKSKCQGRLPGDAAASCRFPGHDRDCGNAHSRKAQT